jgi:hypothetical protein
VSFFKNTPLKEKLTILDVLLFFFISVDKTQHCGKQNDTKTDDKMRTHTKALLIY